MTANDRTSKVPRYVFANDLAQQEAELRTNPLMQRFAESRRQFAADRHRPAYHFVSPESRHNDPNGLCHWQGRWHLFYQGYPPEDPRQHWGHAVSQDLIHWRDLPYAIYPNPERCCYSGATYVEDDRVIAMYHGKGAGTMVAVSSDPLLLNWTKLGDGPVIPDARPGEPELPYWVFDPCIWKHNGIYYALTAGRTQTGPAGKFMRAEFLHRSHDLVRWEYMQPFLEDDAYGLVGDDGACPYFWPIGDQHILLHFSHFSGGKYLLGDYDVQRQKFVVTRGGDFNFGPVEPAGVHAPSACPDGHGNVIAIFNMNPGRPCGDWSQIMTLPRRLTCMDRDTLGVEPAGDIASLRETQISIEPGILPANQEVVLPGVEGDVLEVIAEIAPNGAPLIELCVLRSPDRQEVTRIMFFRDRGYENGDDGRNVKRSCVTIDTSRASIHPDVLSRPPETALVTLADDEPLRLHVFIDRSVVEVFVNERQCLACRVYPEHEDSRGVSLRSQGRNGQLLSFDAWRLKSIYKQPNI